MKKNVKAVSYSFVIADLFHYGHLNLLRTAKENSDYHICGLISDEVAHLWQGVHVCNYYEREEVLKSLDCVDEVIKQNSMDPTENLEQIRRDFPNAKIILVHGDDWKQIPGSDFIKSIGGEVILPEYYKRLSRDEIVKNFQEKRPLDFEKFTHHFRVGNITQFNTQTTSSLLSTKADTLINFKSLLKKSHIEDLFTFKVKQFNSFKNELIKSIQSQFKKKVLIIRSSSKSEDSYMESNAGHFEIGRPEGRSSTLSLTR